MALTNPTHLVTNTSTANAASYVTGGFDTVAGRLYIICYYTRIGVAPAVAVSTITVTSGETVTIDGSFAVTTARGAGFGWFVATGTNTGVTATLDYGGVGQVSQGWSIFEMTGQATSPIAQSTTTTTSATTAHDITLAGAPAASSIVVGVLAANTGNVGSVGPEPSTGTEIGEAANAETNFIGTQYRANQQLKWDSTGSLTGALVAAEIVEAPPVAGGTLQMMGV